MSDILLIIALVAEEPIHTRRFIASIYGVIECLQPSPQQAPL